MVLEIRKSGPTRKISRTRLTHRGRGRALSAMVDSRTFTREVRRPRTAKLIKANHERVVRVAQVNNKIKVSVNLQIIYI